MAKELGGGASSEIKEQKAKEGRIAFLAVKIVAVAGAAIFAVYSLVGGFGSYQAAMDNEARYGELDRQYQTLQAEAAKWHEENDNKPDDVDEETGEAFVEREMYSARLAGIELAALQNLYYQNKELLQADRQRLNELSKNTSSWIGANWDPAKTPIRWDFVTFYDATDKNYDVCWQCWHEAPSHTMYLIAVQFGVFDGETGTFRLTDLYETDFSRMLNRTGAVEAGEPVEMDMRTQQMVSDLLNGGGTGDIPADDSGQSAGVRQELQDENEDQDESGQDDPGEIAGGPAGGGGV